MKAWLASQELFTACVMTPLHSLSLKTTQPLTSLEDVCKQVHYQYHELFVVSDNNDCRYICTAVVYCKLIDIQTYKGIAIKRGLVVIPMAAFGTSRVRCIGNPVLYWVGEVK